MMLAIITLSKWSIIELCLFVVLRHNNSASPQLTIYRSTMCDDTFKLIKPTPELSQLNSTYLIILAGFSPEKLQAPSDFIGCVRGVRFLQGAATSGDLERPDLELAVPIHARAEVTDGCVNACDAHNMCVHGGMCLNYYTYTTCDCFGSGYEGRYCQRPGERGKGTLVPYWMHCPTLATLVPAR